MHPGLLTLTLTLTLPLTLTLTPTLTLTLTQARVAAISQVAREEGSPLGERAARAAAEDAEGDDELIA